MSVLRVNSDGYLGRTGRRVQLTHGVAKTVILGRLWQIGTGTRLASATGFPFLTARHVFEFLTQAGNTAAGGDLIEPYSGGAVGSVKYLLYCQYEHDVAEMSSWKKFYALRVNVTGLTVQRYKGTAGPRGGETMALDTTPVATGVIGHFWEADETIELKEGNRTEKFSGVLVTKSGLGIAVNDIVTVDSTVYEIAGFDTLALDGLVVNRLLRKK